MNIYRPFYPSTITGHFAKRKDLWPDCLARKHGFLCAKNAGRKLEWYIYRWWWLLYCSTTYIPTVMPYCPGITETWQNKAWMTKPLEPSIRRRNKLHKDCFVQPGNSIHNKYKPYKNILRKYSRYDNIDNRYDKIKFVWRRIQSTNNSSCKI